MRIIRFLYHRESKWGILEDKKILVLKEIFPKPSLSKERISFLKVRLLAPANPAKIVLVGLNYKDHAKELDMPLPKEPIIFLKPASSLIGHLGKIVYPCGVKRLDYEAELALVIKKRARDIKISQVKDYILGYSCLNDITARDLQKKDGQWTRAKSFDTFCPFGPWIEKN